MRTLQSMASRSTRSRAHSRTGVGLVLLATCTTLGLLFATHFRFYYRIDWTLALWWGLKNWYLWGLFAPGVVWLVRRVPPGRVGWSRTVAVHLAGAVALALLHPTLAIALSALAEGLDEATFFEAVRGLFLKRYALSFVTYGALAGTGALLLPRHAHAAAGSIHQPATRPLRILFLGGTDFVGPAIVDLVLERGHEVTLFNRWRTHPWLYTHLERLVGNRYPDRDDGPAVARREEEVLAAWHAAR